MNINIFKNKELWNELESYNNDIVEIYNNDGGKGSTHWFNPNSLRTKMWLRQSPNSKKVRLDDLEYNKEYKLILDAGNYLTIFLINKLYKDKNILIEDVCCGMGRLVYYLSKLGYNNYSLIDDFSGVTPKLFNSVMEKNDINFVLNHKKTKPVISNLVSYPWYLNPTPNEVSPKDEIPTDSCELFCFYCAGNIFETIGKYLLENGYKELCLSQDKISVAFCKENKYNEFKEEIKEYET